MPSLDPLDRLRAVAAGTAHLGPGTSRVGTLVDEVERGRIVARVPALPDAELRGGGALLVLADLALSAAVASALPAGRSVATLTLHASGLGPVPDAGAALVAEGRVAHLDDDSAVSTADVRTADGEPVALLSSRCALLPVPDAFGRDDRARDPSPSPFAPLRVVADPECVRAVAAPELANSAGAVQGGVLAALAAHGLDLALGDPPAPTVADLALTYLRAVPADGAPVEVAAEVVHRGSRFTSARAELRDALGRVALVATASRWRGALPPPEW